MLARYEVNCFVLLHRTAQTVPADSEYDLSNLKSTVSAGESVNPEVIDRWHALTGTTVLDGYGQTETLMTVTNRPGLPVKPGSMGVPLPGLTVGVYDADAKAVTPTGAGELVLALPYPQLMLGYWEDEGRTAGTRVTAAGREWYATGDNVEIDDEGYVFFTPCRRTHLLPATALRPPVENARPNRRRRSARCEAA